MRAEAWARRRWIALAVVAVVTLGGGLRVHAAANHDPSLSSDERGYAREAFNLSRGSYQHFRWPPGAPAMFAASRVFDGGRDLPAAYWLQAVVGTLLIAVCLALGWVAAGPITGLLAAALVAFYPPFITLTGSLQSEPLGTLALAMAMLAVSWALGRDGRLRWWALAGGLFGAAVLTRTDLILAPVIVAVLATPVLWRRAGLRPAAAPMAMLLGVFVLCLVPWTAFASHRLGHFTPVTEGDAPALYVGTFLPGNGTTLGVKRVFGDRLRARDHRLLGVPDSRLDASAVLGLVAEQRPGLTRDDALRALAQTNLRRYALGRPLDFARMMATKVQRTWLLSSRAGAADKSELTRAYHVVLVIVCLALMLVIAILRRNALVGMCLALVAYSMLLHAVFVAKPRYNLPLMPLLIVGGVVAGSVLLQRARSRRASAPRDAVA